MKIFLFCRPEEKMSYKERAEFDPAKHGLDPKFRLTNYTKLKG